MKEELIKAFKKILETITDFNDINIDIHYNLKSHQYDIICRFNKFILKKEDNEYILQYKSIKNNIDYNEFTELLTIVEDKKSKLKQKKYIKDCDEIKLILNS